jgi:hypothetical protein
VLGRGAAAAAAGRLSQDWTFPPRGGSEETLFCQSALMGGWVIETGALDFPCVSVKNMESLRALT